MECRLLTIKVWKYVFQLVTHNSLSQIKYKTKKADARTTPSYFPVLYLSVLWCNCWTYNDNISPKLKKLSFAILGASFNYIHPPTSAPLQTQPWGQWIILSHKFWAPLQQHLGINLNNFEHFFIFFIIKYFYLFSKHF